MAEVRLQKGELFESSRPNRTILQGPCCLTENDFMTGIQFVTNEKGRKVAVLIDLKKHGVRLQDFWDGLISEKRRKEKSIPLQKIKADLIKRGRLRG
jgi:hypothetical protein